MSEKRCPPKIDGLHRSSSQRLPIWFPQDTETSPTPSGAPVQSIVGHDNRRRRSSGQRCNQQIPAQSGYYRLNRSRLIRTHRICSVRATAKRTPARGDQQRYNRNTKLQPHWGSESIARYVFVLKSFRLHIEQGLTAELTQRREFNQAS